MQSKDGVNILLLLEVLHYSVLIVFIKRHNFHHNTRHLELWRFLFGWIGWFVFFDLGFCSAKR